MGNKLMEKSSKSQLGSYMFVYTPILYAYNTNNIKLKIFYYNWEESAEVIIIRFIAFLLYKYKGIIVSPRDLQSTTKAANIEWLDAAKNEFKDILEFFTNHVAFMKGRDSETVLSTLTNYAEKNGSWNGEEGERLYSMNESNEYRIVFVDHISLIDPKGKQNRYDAIGDLSKGFIRLRDDYKYTIVAIQQQAKAVQSLDAFNAKRMEPSVDNLDWNKSTSNDVNLLLGIFSPFHVKLTNYMGYDITRLRDKLRFLSVIRNRDGVLGGILPLYTEGACSWFEQIPGPQSPDINKIYDRVKPNKIMLLKRCLKSVKLLK